MNWSILFLRTSLIAAAALQLSCDSTTTSTSDSALQDISDVQSLSRRSDGQFDVVCRDGRREIATEADVLANRVCDAPGSSGTFIYGQSDSCASSAVVVEVTALTDCRRLSDTAPAWSVKVGGACRNISDTTVQRACFQLKAESGTVIYGRTDSCAVSDIVTIVDDRTDCSSLSSTQEAWSIKVDGSCRNISDTNVRAACYQIKGPTSNLLYGRTDSCSSSDILAEVHAQTDCNQFATTGEVWSIRVGGQCQNISDTNPRAGCYQIKERLGGHFIYGRSDSCAASDLVAEVSTLTDCNAFSSTNLAWSIKANGQCVNISDTNVRAACFDLKQRIR